MNNRLTRAFAIASLIGAYSQAATNQPGAPAAPVPIPGAPVPAAVAPAVPTPVPQTPGSTPVPATMPLAVAPAQSAMVATPSHSYSYYGERYRDPFVPLLGEFRSDSAYDRPPQIASLALKGIVQDASGRMALLTSGVSSYILRGGKLYDGRNRVVKKISGVIKADSVVLVGADRTVRELRTKVNL